MAGKKKKKGAKPSPAAAEPTPAPAEAAAPDRTDEAPASGGGGTAAGGTGGGSSSGGSRRSFLKLVGVGAAVAGAAGIWVARQRSGGQGGERDAGEPDGGEHHDLQPVPRPADLVTFDAHEYDTLDAIAGVLLPADGQDPGARETGAMIYVDRAMATPAFAVGARGMKVGVKAFDWQSNHAYGKKFVELSFAEQQAVVDAVYQGEADKGRFKGRTFMTLMMSMVLEGHLSEPSYGGNRDEMGWKLVAFEPVDPRPGHPMAPGGHMGHMGHDEKSGS